METNEQTLNQLLEKKTSGEVAVSNLRATARKIWLAHFPGDAVSTNHLICDIFLRQYTWKKISDDGNYFTFDDEVDSKIKDIPLFNFINKIACSLAIDLITSDAIDVDKLHSMKSLELKLISAKEDKINKTLVLGKDDIKLLFGKELRVLYANLIRIKQTARSRQIGNYLQVLRSCRKNKILSVRPEPSSRMLYLAYKLEDIAAGGFWGMALKNDEYSLLNTKTYLYCIPLIGCALLAQHLHNQAYKQCEEYDKACDTVERTRSQLMRFSFSS